ncbi:MAG: isoprenylcysteine carboxylmethyltransferase family protein [Gemmatimonadales bacterium]
MPWYQTAERAPTSWLVIKTTVHVAVVWAIGLYLLPHLIISWQSAMELHELFFEPQQNLAVGVMVLASAVSLWSALLLAVKGRGTPARVNAPRHLVIDGPYAWVRNPMVVSGLMQGIAVALYTGSALILIVLAMAAIFWHLVRRRDEEHDLQRVFGRSYELYRRSVRCWMPRRRRWAPAQPEASIAAQTLRVPSSGRRRSR